MEQSRATHSVISSVEIGGGGKVPPVRGRALRFILVDEMMRHGEMTVAQMVSVLDGHGFDLGGRASKVISDALRWETRRGRVVRLGRGRYRFVRAARSTVRRIGILAARSRAWVVAIMRRPEARAAPDPAPVAVPYGVTMWAKPPWADLAWLRNT